MPARNASAIAIALGSASTTLARFPCVLAASLAQQHCCCSADSAFACASACLPSACSVCNFAPMLSPNPRLRCRWKIQMPYCYRDLGPRTVLEIRSGFSSHFFVEWQEPIALTIPSPSAMIVSSVAPRRTDPDVNGRVPRLDFTRCRIVRRRR